MDKAHILSEIKRTAAANGGKPLGMDRFFAETGIQRGDWLGKYWARWSDALQEADLAPNAFGKEAIPEAELLLRLAELARRLGHVPAKSEMMLERSRDATFPTQTVYQRRLGDKAVQVALLRKFCIEAGDYADVATICEEYLDRRPAKNAASPGPADAEPAGSFTSYSRAVITRLARRTPLGGGSASSRSSFPNVLASFTRSRRPTHQGSSGTGMTASATAG